MSEEFTNKILDALKEEDVKCKSRLSFLMKDWLLWASAGFVILLGALGIAATLAIIAMADWDLVERLEHTHASFALMSVPPAWILLVILFIILADYNIRHTRRGYKLSLLKLVGAVIGSSVVLGVLLFSVGAGAIVDREFAEHMPYYDHVANRKPLHLLQPEYGVLAGIVQSIDDEEDIWTVEDIKKNIWSVEVEEAEIIGDEYIVVGRPVRIIGERDDEDSYHFEAEEISPMRPPRDAHKKIHRLRVEFRQQTPRDMQKQKPGAPQRLQTTQ